MIPNSLPATSSNEEAPVTHNIAMDRRRIPLRPVELRGACDSASADALESRRSHPAGALLRCLAVRWGGGVEGKRERGDLLGCHASAGHPEACSIGQARPVALARTVRWPRSGSNGAHSGMFPCFRGGRV